MSTPSTPSDGTPAAWSGRFSEPVSELVKRYTASVDFDQRLAEFDIQGSLAHAAMLHHVGIIAKDDLAAIQRGMAEIADRNPRRPVRLVARPGRRAPQHRKAPDRAGRRCRQAPAHRPFAQRPGGHRYPPLSARRDRSTFWSAQGLPDSPCSIWPSSTRDTVMPGFTHLQVAQPVTFGHHLMAYFEMLERDAERLRRLPQARQPPAAGRGRAGRHQLSRSTANSSRANWASTASAKTRWTPFPTAISPSNSPPPPR